MPGGCTLLAVSVYSRCYTGPMLYLFASPPDWSEIGLLLRRLQSVLGTRVLPELLMRFGYGLRDFGRSGDFAAVLSRVVLSTLSDSSAGGHNM